ncbi:MAG: ABC transporter substrate-binding protein [Frankia sp.]
MGERGYLRSSGSKLAIGLAALALAGSACGSSGSGSGGSTSGSTSSGQQATGSTWVLGDVGSFSGRASSTLAPTKKAMQAWVSWTNAHGGINGHQIKVVYGDDQNDPSIGLSLVQNMVQSDHIIAMVGSAANSTSSWASYLSSRGIPVIGGSASTFLAGEKPYPAHVYAVGPSLAASSVTSFRAAKAAGASKVGILYCAESATCQSVVSTFKAFAGQAGLTVSYQAAVSATAPNYTAPCLALKNSGADGLVLAVDNHTIQSIAQQCAQQSFNPIIIGQAGEIVPAWATDESFSKSVGSVVAFPWWQTSVPAIAEYTSAMKQYDNSGDQSAAKNPSIATNTWAAGEAFAAAAKAANLGDNPTPAQVISGLNTFKDETLNGLLPPLTFSDTNLLGSNCAFEFHVVNKAFETLNGGKADCVS